MSATVDNSGIACCGNCRAHLAITCSANCEHPDTDFPDNPVAALPKPRGRGAKKKVLKYPPPTHCWCGAPVATRKPGRGRPPTKCEKHLPRSRAKTVTLPALAA